MSSSARVHAHAHPDGTPGTLPFLQRSVVVASISVVTPAYNERRYLTRVIESVAAQTWPVLEHIIIDDGSSDGSFQLLEQLGERYPHLVILRQKRGGAASARNRGIDIARGQYIAFLDADDTWLPTKVERQISFMQEHKVTFSYGDYEELHHESRTHMRRYHFPDALGHTQLLRGCPIGCLTVAYDQHALGKHYFPLVKSGHDWGLWLELTQTGAHARKYPGLEACYSNGRPSLSTRKFLKMTHIYSLYRTQAHMSRFCAITHTLQHSILAAAKKLRLIYFS